MTMNNAKPKAVAEINLEEFERRLRASAAPQAGVEDPLAELTRLVDTIGFERSPAERLLDMGRPQKAAPAPPPKPEPALPPPESFTALPPPPAEEPAPPPPQPTPPAALSPVDEPLAAEPRGTTLDTGPLLRPALDAEDLEALAFEPAAPAPPPAVARTLPPRPAVAKERPARSPMWALKIGGLIAAAAAMTVAVVIFKTGDHRRAGEVPLIAAATTPAKVAPPSEETVRTNNEAGSLLNHDSAQAKPAAPKLVDTPEAPVDLNARREALASPSPDATESSPVAPSGNTPIVAAPSPNAPAAPVSSDPSRVKTISVRPDGSLIVPGADAAVNKAATTAAPADKATAQKPDMRAAADGEASTPPVSLPTKLSPPKSGSHAVSPTATTAPADEGAGPVPVKPKKPKPTPTSVAEESDGADAAPTAPTGGYAVQLAAPRSESDAKSIIKRLQSKYADALGETSLGVRKADRNGETIYRVRAGALSRADAAAMCKKIKDAGGDCFVAKN